ncbi:MAG: hypothetical protein QNJ97_26760 [Myxococcota bacterium]|nr:hypothetical protein [Myxococcota bacterium]
MKFSTVTVFVLLLAMGCLPDTSGIDPPKDRLIYPVGMAVVEVDPANASAGRFLVVANSNFDLNYNSGSIVAIDLNKLYSILDSLENDQAYYNARKDWFSKDSKDVYIPTKEVIDVNNTIRIGSFASDLALTQSKDRVIVPVRGDSAIVIVELNRGDPSRPVFYCGQDQDGQCDNGHKVKSNEDYSLPLEPYEVASLDYDNVTLGFATHLAGGEVSMFVIDQNGSVSPELIRVVDSVAPGATGIAVRQDPVDPGDSEIYITGRRDPFPRVVIMQVRTDTGNVDYIKNSYFDDVGRISISSEIYGGTDLRSIAVAENGVDAYVVSRSPEAVLQLDLDHRDVTDMVSMGFGSEPSVVELYTDDGNTEDPADDVVLAFVLCFLRDQLYVLETDIMMQPHVLTTGVGPHAVAFDKAHRKAFVANFRESTISIINIDAVNRQFKHATVKPNTSPDETPAAKIKIGKPRLPEGHS